MSEMRTSKGSDFRQRSFVRGHPPNVSQRATAALG